LGSIREKHPKQNTANGAILAVENSSTNTFHLVRKSELNNGLRIPSHRFSFTCAVTTWQNL